MRIVIDLQNVQLHGPEHGSSPQVLDFAAALVRTPGAHAVWILLNGALPHGEALRRRFDGLIARDRIHVVDSLTPSTGQAQAQRERRCANELLREYAVTQLHADVVLFDGLFNGLSDESVVSVGQFARAARYGILLDHVPDAGTQAAAECAVFYDSRLALLREAALVLALNTEAYRQACAELAPARVLALAGMRADAAAELTLASLTAPENATPAPKPARVRRRLAFVTPLPPARTGIADYAAQLLPAMLDDFDIVLIIEQQEVILPAPLASLRRHDAAWLDANAHQFDQILYQFGNSPFHSSMFPLLARHPGVVVLHDFYLSNVLAYEQMTGGIPNAWSDALFHSHGYRGLRASQLPDNHAAAMNDFPCNLEVLQGATRVIVHSEHARQLACEWYGDESARSWTVVPLPRAAPALQDRRAARAALGIPEDSFLVCTFGYIGPSKLSDVLLEAWLASSLHHDAQCELVLVGANHTGEFGMRLADTIENADAGRRIRIAGWTDDAAYHQYLQAADMGVQLRSISRGETSAAVLDAMNYGLPTIVNANGSMAALSPDAVWMLPDQFQLDELVQALDVLRHDAERRTELGARARDMLRNQHRPDHCAARYRDALDLAMTETDTGRPALLRRLATLDALRSDDSVLRQLATAVAGAPDPLAPRQLLIDVSTIVQHDLKTGIERVVRTQLLELLKLDQRALRIEPVYLSTAGGRWHFRYARRYAGQLLGIAGASLIDAPVDVQPGDLYYCADYSPNAMVEAAGAGVYAQLRSRGVSINFLIHDLLPVLRPEFFPSVSESVHARWLRCVAAQADRLLCISGAVAREAEDWLRSQGALPTYPLKLAVLHHGADIDHSTAGGGDAKVAVDMAATLAARPSFLMVGTIEPRKGHLQALAAFEELWAAGEQINLVIVGNEGWKGLPQSERRTIPTIVQRLGKHPESGHRLLWLQGVDDQMLETIYRNSTCLLQPSEGEGFGLPLIEAARYGLPILARGIPVFREVAEEHALYFDGIEPTALADAVRQWMALRAEGKVPSSGTMQSRTWRENAQQLLSLLDDTLPQRELVSAGAPSEMVLTAVLA